MRELMGHTAGFTYGLMPNSGSTKMYLDQKVMQSKSLQERIDKLRRLRCFISPEALVYQRVDVSRAILLKSCRPVFVPISAASVFSGLCA